MREIRIVTLSNVSRRGFRSLRTGLDCLVLFLIATAMYLAIAVAMAALLQIESILVGNVLAVAFLTLLAYLVLVGRVARFPQRQIYHAFWNDHETRLALWFTAAAIFAVIVGALVVAAGCRVDRSPGCVANVSGFLLLQFTPLWSVGALLVCIGRAVFRRTAVPFLGPQPLRAIGRVRGDMATSRLTRKLPRSLARSAAATLAIALFGTASAWAYASTLPMFRSSIPSGSTQETLLAAALFTIGLVVILLLAYVVVAYIRSDALDAAPAGTRPVVLFLRPFGRRARKLESSAVRALEYRAPFVAIGEPEEVVPKIGAYRTYSSDDGWRQTILTYIAVADTIVLVAGTTPGILWELEQVKQAGKLGSAIVLLPPVPAGETRELLTATANAIGLNYRFGDDAVSAAAPVALSFDPHGEAILIRSPKRDGSAYELAIYVLRQYMGA